MLGLTLRIPTLGFTKEMQLTPDRAIFIFKLWLALWDCRPTYEEALAGPSFVYSHIRRASPVVARYSIAGDLEAHGWLSAEAGCHCRLVAG